MNHTNTILTILTGAALIAVTIEAVAIVYGLWAALRLLTGLIAVAVGE
ncbi:MAG: hypothetical protein LBV00_11420 [Propionibacteriaceae bacterium]|jgi:hypothetical protein|nr:hypothetical protein [Propionibacteriaceae bacterium]